MTYHDHTLLKIDVRDGIARVAIDNPPINLLDIALVRELQQFIREVRDDREVRVIVVESAIPDFWVAHLDLGLTTDPARFADIADSEPTDLNPMQTLWERWRTLPQVTIGKLQGRLRGGGNEFAMALDVRYAAAGTTWLSQFESRVGFFPGGGGTQHLTRAIGYSRAIEAILGGGLVDAEKAERVGWINRAVPADQLNAVVDELAGRVAALTSQTVSAAKAAVAFAAGGSDVHAGMLEEGAQLYTVYPAPDPVMARLQALLDSGLQDRTSELRLEDFIDSRR